MYTTIQTFGINGQVLRSVLYTQKWHIMALKGPKFLEYNEADFGTITEFNKKTLEADKIYQ